MNKPDYDRDILGKVKLQVGTQYYIPMPGGYLEVIASPDSNYPGVDIEFIADNVPDGQISRPRVIVENPLNYGVKGNYEGLRCLVWTDHNSEDYTEDLDFK